MVSQTYHILNRTIKDMNEDQLRDGIWKLIKFTKLTYRDINLLLKHKE